MQTRLRPASRHQACVAGSRGDEEREFAKYPSAYTLPLGVLRAVPPPPAVESKACFEGKGLFTRVHASTARRPRSPSMPGPSGMPDVMLSMFVVLAVAEEVESLNRKLYDSVVATLERAPAHAKTLIWPMGLAVRAQCALEMARSPVAELLGRVIDAALSAGGDGRGFKPWATLPLQAECRPPRPTLVASSHGATCARFGASSASATASTGQPACTAESAASAPDMPRNLSLSSAWAAVITMLARAAWWRSDGKMGSTCAAPATQPATPHKYRESAPSKSLLGSAVGTMLFCAVTLNFSVLSPEAALMQFDEVPFDTPRRRRPVRVFASRQQKLRSRWHGCLQKFWLRPRPLTAT